MTYKEFTIFLSGAVFVLCLTGFGIRAMPSALYQSNDITEESLSSDKNGRIHGWIVYDQHADLPVQAVLVVQLAARDPAGESETVITEIHHKITDQLPTSFTLPVSIEELDNNVSYTLQTRISVGDELWFVNERPMPIEQERTAYLIHLTMIKRKNIIARNPAGQEDAGNGSIFNSSAVYKMPIMNYTAKTDPEDRIKKHDTITDSSNCDLYFTIEQQNKKENISQYEFPGMTFKAPCPEKISRQEGRFIDILPKTKSHRANQTGDPGTSIFQSYQLIND